MTRKENYKENNNKGNNKSNNKSNSKGSGMMEVVFILDRSGSMCGMEADTIGGFNDLLPQQMKTNTVLPVPYYFFEFEAAFLQAAS